MAVEYQIEAILLATRDWSVADRVVTLFSREYGIIRAMAYGARKPKSKLGGSLQPFTHLSLAMTAGKGMDAVKQCEVQTSFREIREDLTKLAYANFIAELATGLWPERQPEAAAYDTLLAVFHLLAVRNPRISALAGAWQLLALAGFQPEYERCAQCGKKLIFPVSFSFAAGGSTCAECSLANDPVFHQADQKFLEQVCTLDLDNPGQFAVNARILGNIETLLYGFVRHQLERPLKSLEFINRINSL